MIGNRPVSRRVVAAAMAGAMALSPVASLVARQGGTPAPVSSKGAPPSSKAAASSAAAAPRLDDGGWPRDLQASGGATIRVFQPQVASWDGQRRMVAYAAVAYTAQGAAKAALGSVKVEADTTVAVAERLVNFTQLKLTESNFPDLTKEQVREIVGQIEQTVPKGEMVIGLDRVLARLDKSQIMPKNVEGVKADPPVIFYSRSKAVLLNIDSDPVWSPIKDNDLRFVVNTNWDLFEYPPTKTLYLRYEQNWLSAPSVEGPWKPAGKLPDAFAKLPADKNWDEVKTAVPGRTLAAAEMPTVFVSTKPAEMILLHGDPNYQLVTGTKLLWISNTDSDLFRLEKNGPLFYLISGRWFSAQSFSGPWTFATQNLPEDFKKIPPSHPRSRVLASVPGTNEAAEAVLLAQVPQTARIDKKQVKAPEVEYQGDPQFQPIETTTVSRAVNTDKDIIKVGDVYYMCFQGVWFMSKSASGPWEVTGSVPGQIYEIPASSPAYNVTNVTVVEDNSDAVVFATAAAYTGMMVAWGCVVWGTGYYYPPYYGYGGFYPYYYPHYPTYGYGASYNPWTGAYTRGAVAYGPYGGAGVASRYNPRTGTYSRGAAAYGPYGARGAAEAYNPRTGTYGQTRQGSGVYGSWGQTGVTRGDQWATTSRVTNNRTGATTRVTQGSGGGAAVTRNGVANNSGVARTGSGDVYAGRDGNVYRKQEGGGWQQYGGGGDWNSAQQPNPQERDQLNRDSAARAEGAQRTNSGNAARSTGSSSYRPSTATRSAPRGGGGRRR
jgi:hypothetical protein